MNNTSDHCTSAAEEKFKPPFKFVNYAKLIFSCNKIPETEDQTDAFFRRLIIINLTTQFFGDKEDFDLIQKLTTDEELTILLHEILSRVPRILGEGLRKTTNERIAETYGKYTKGSNPVKAFYEKAIGPEVGGRIPKMACSSTNWKSSYYCSKVNAAMWLILLDIADTTVRLSLWLVGPDKNNKGLVRLF